MPRPRLLLRVKKSLAQWLTLAVCEPIEPASGTVFFCWGILLLLPADSLANLFLWRLLVKLLSEPVWGIVFLSIGLLQLGTFTFGNRESRASVTFMSACLWMFISIYFGLAYLPNTASPTYGVLALYNFLNYLRLRGTL